MSLRIASINVERSKHRRRVKTFINTYQPDILLLQELCPRDLPFLMGLDYGHFTYCPQGLHWVKSMPFGLGIVSRRPLHNVRLCNLFGNHNLPDITSEHDERLIFATVFDGLEPVRIATTHLRVTTHGEVTPEQMESISALTFLAGQEAETHGGLLLGGDFNAPRGRAAFDTIAMYFRDSIPAHYTTSIDGALHRDGPIPLMVDGLFHTPNYGLEDVTLHTGVSDHCAVTGTLSYA